MWHITQIHKVQILLFCYIDNYIFLCYSLFVSRFFYFKFLNQRKLMSVTSENSCLFTPFNTIEQEMMKDRAFVLCIAVVYSPADV
jgi:hypothetical protein